MPDPLTGKLIPGDHRVAVVAARFNAFIVDHLLSAAVDTWRQLGGADDRLTVLRVPGSFELPVAARKLALSGRYGAVICLGCVIRGETDHYDHVVAQTARGIEEVGVQTGVPCIFGVLTCDDLEQAIHRAGAKMGNAGRSAMMTAVEMANLLADGTANTGADRASHVTPKPPSPAVLHATPILSVKSVEDAIDCFTQKLGFGVTFTWRGDDADGPMGFAGVGRGKSEVFLCRDAQGAPGTWLTVWVDDVDALHRELVERGADIRQPPTTFAWGVREMNVAATDGHRIRFSTGTSAPPDGVPLKED